MKMLVTVSFTQGPDHAFEVSECELEAFLHILAKNDGVVSARVDF